MNIDFTREEFEFIKRFTERALVFLDMSANLMNYDAEDGDKEKAKKLLDKLGKEYQE